MFASGGSHNPLPRVETYLPRRNLTLASSYDYRRNTKPVSAITRCFFHFTAPIVSSVPSPHSSVQLSSESPTQMTTSSPFHQPTKGLRSVLSTHHSHPFLPPSSAHRFLKTFSPNQQEYHDYIEKLLLTNVNCFSSPTFLPPTATFLTLPPHSQTFLSSTEITEYTQAHTCSTFTAQLSH